MSKLSISTIRSMPGVSTASEWRDRVYVNLRGNGGNYAGERTSKVWIDAANVLHVDMGKGIVSSAWSDSLNLFRDAYTAAMAV